MSVVNLGVVPESLWCELCYIDSWVPAGFPSPAADYADRPLDLVERLIPNRAATFLMTVTGHSMRDEGLLDGDLLVVDRSLTPTSGRIVVATVNGELTVKRFRRERGVVWLEAANPDYPPIYFQGESELCIFGVVTYAIHNLV